MVFILILCFILYLVPFYLKNSFARINKRATLEAGFFTTGKIKHGFSIQFVLLMLVFILFDTEILFTFGLILNIFKLFILNTLLLFFLFITLMLEWKWNKLIWLSLLIIDNYSSRISTPIIKINIFGFFIYVCFYFFCLFNPSK